MARGVLAIASGGGHWVQLMRLRPVFEGLPVAWITTHAEYRSDVVGTVHVVQDANLWNKAALLKMFLQVAWIVLRERPKVVVTTGAAPGLRGHGLRASLRSQDRLDRQHRELRGAVDLGPEGGPMG